jgi:hypothetical protein
MMSASGQKATSSWRKPTFGAALKADTFAVRFYDARKGICPAKQINFGACWAEQFGAGTLYSARNHRRNFRVQDRIQIDEVHDREIRMEIGERLRQALSRDEPQLPASLERRLTRLRELDEGDSPSIIR